ncbi:MAG: hypothetical protein KGM99_10800 [Burkholderiales bacterium]|nr:hypothetical protein [Burkholderiales bacterium]
MKVELFDEDGVIAIVNADRYRGFVDNDWSLNQLLDHFVNEMICENLIVWQSNNIGGGDWKIEILVTPSERKSFREFEQTINVTDGELYLASYTDLTMAAQFEDEVIPSKENANLKCKLANGKYLVIVRQMFHPESCENEESDETDFEIILKPVIDHIVTKVDAVYWWNY